MKISTTGVTVAIAMFAGAGLSGCASDRNHTQTYGAVASYNQPVVYQTQTGRWIDPPANRYYDPRSNEPSGRGPQ